MHDNVRMQVLLCEALEDIHKGRELIWDYGEGYWKQLQILLSPLFLAHMLNFVHKLSRKTLFDEGFIQLSVKCDGYTTRRLYKQTFPL